MEHWVTQDMQWSAVWAKQRCSMDDWLTRILRRRSTSIIVSSQRIWWHLVLPNFILYAHKRRGIATVSAFCLNFWIIILLLFVCVCLVCVLLDLSEASLNYNLPRLASDGIRLVLHLNGFTLLIDCILIQRRKGKLTVWTLSHWLMRLRMLIINDLDVLLIINLLLFIHIVVIIVAKFL